MAAMGGPDVTVVVPVLHDSPALARLLGEPCTYDHGARWIVVNGGARDEALNVLRAARPDVLWLDSPPGRGVQIGAASIRAGMDEIVLAGGTESLSSTPQLLKSVPASARDPTTR